MGSRIFILDDDVEWCDDACRLLASEGYQSEYANTIVEGHQSVAAFRPDLCLLDLKLPDGNGIDFLQSHKSTSPELLVIMLSGQADIAHAVKAIKLGAEDFLTKPIDPDYLLLQIQRLLDRKRLANHARVLELEIASSRRMIVGQSEAMQTMLNTCARAARANSTILLTGETGTGKHLAAHYIHQQSSRADFPFVYVNCATLSENLLESDLFGHEKGAFTGAQKQKIGRVELAGGGTLFLDEIGEVPLDLQAKLLHFLEYGQFQRVGGVETRQSDARIVCATNRDLKTEVAEGRFRDDLYYRINVIRIDIPPLRERREDIKPLIDYFIEKFSRELGRVKPPMSDELLDELVRQSWPGNIRELQNAMERAMVLNESGDLSGIDFPFLEQPPNPDNGQQLLKPRLMRDALNEFRKAFIAEVLRETGGNQTEAARLLGVQRSHLNQTIKKLNINP